MNEPDGSSYENWVMKNGTTWSVMPNRTRADDRIHLLLESDGPRPALLTENVGREAGGGWVSIEGVVLVLLGNDPRRISANLLIQSHDDARDLAHAILRAIEEIRGKNDESV